LLIRLDKEMTWLAPHDGKPGHPAVVSEAAIRFCLAIKVLSKQPLRQTTGMVASPLKLANLDWAVPDFPPCADDRRRWPSRVPTGAQMAL
jgi:hypothetical protein